MRRILTLLATVLLTSSVYGQQIKEHTVASGENLQTIAKLYGISVEELKSANSGLDDYVFVGMVLKLPSKSNPPKNIIFSADDALKDVIYLNDGSELVSKIINTDNSVVTFEQYDSDEPFSISKAVISKIVFEDGKIEDYSKPKSTTSKRRRR